MIRASAIVGMVASAVWIIALVVEYQFGLQPPGDGSALYHADQAAFTLAELGYISAHTEHVPDKNAEQKELVARETNQASGRANVRSQSLQM